MCRKYLPICVIAVSFFVVVVITDLICFSRFLILSFKPLVHLENILTLTRVKIQERSRITRHDVFLSSYLDDFPQFSSFNRDAILLVHQWVGRIKRPRDQDQLAIVLFKNNRESFWHSHVPQSLLQGEACPYGSCLVPKQQGTSSYYKAEAHQGGKPRRL